MLSGRNQVKTLAASDPQRWCLGDELWHSFGGHCMRYLRLTPRQATGLLSGNTGLETEVVPHLSRPPLILIHGLLGYSFSWRRNLEAFAGKREVYAVDLLGIGYSDRPRPGSVDFGLHATATRMLDWLQALGLKNVDLLGTSHGGAVAMMMAALEREQGPGTAIGRLVLSAPANPWSRSGAGRIAVLSSWIGRWMAGLLLGSARLQWRAQSIALKRMYGDPRRITPDTLDGYRRMVAIPGAIDYALEVVRSWNQDMRELKSAFHFLVDVPALLLWGSLDRAVAPASAYELAANLRNARLVVMDGIGHMPYEEAPEQFNRLILDFLDRSSSPADESERAGSPDSRKVRQ
jgi:pimeloyl-ACP methyl ester carboxylesterase